MRALAVLLALAAAALIAIGAGMVFLPAGLIVGGIELAGGAYMAAEYAKATQATKGRRE